MGSCVSERTPNRRSEAVRYSIPRWNNGAMGRWELWEGEGGTTFFPEWNDKARRMAEKEGLALVWHVEAQGYNPAMRALNEHLGLDPYKTMLRDDGTPYPEDEDESFAKREHS